MCQLDQLMKLKEQLLEIARQHKTRRLFVFGSCARKEERPDSDVDFIADFQPHIFLLDHAGLEVDLAEFLGRKVDVVAYQVLKDDAFGRSARKDMVELC